MSLLLLRADASPAIGVGHVMRCLALGAAWASRGGDVALASTDLPSSLARRCVEAGVAHWPLPPSAADRDVWIAAKARAHGASVAMVDGSWPAQHLQTALRAQGVTVGVMDDDAKRLNWIADLLVNQNLDADPAVYAGRAPGARLLCGARFAMLRSEFASPPPPRTTASQATEVLITFGGSDPLQLTEAVVAAMVQSGLAHRLRPIVVVGPANLRAHAIAAALGDHGELAVDPPSMLALMRRADLAVTAGGSALWELAFAGVPMLVGAVGPMEVRASQAMTRRGAAQYLGRFSDVAPAVTVENLRRLADNPAARAAMSAAGQHLIDGGGAARVADALAELAARRDP